MVPLNIAKQLRSSLGDDAAEMLVSWVEELRAEGEKERAAIRAEWSGFRQEMKEMRAEMKEMRADMHGMETRLLERIHTVDVNVAGVKSDLMKWSFVFWCGAVAAIAALAGVLRT